MKKKTILLVEDNPDDETLFLSALEQSQVEARLIVAHDGTEALDQLMPPDPSRGHTGIRPHLVLLDLRMPKMDGLEVLRDLRADERTRHLPIVVFTSSDEETDIWDSYQLGASSFVRKPIEFQEFRQAVKDVVHYWLIRNEPATLKHFANVRMAKVRR